MKNWALISVAVVALAVGIGGWFLSDRGTDSSDDAGRTLSVKTRRRSPRNKTKHPKKRIARRVAAEANVSQTVSNSDFKIDDDSGIDKEFLDETEKILAETSEVVRRIYKEIEDAMNRFDKKAIQASVRKLLAAIAAGQSVPRFAKLKAIEALKLGGSSDSLAELIGLASDLDPMVSSTAIEALEEVLWDFDSSPQQIAGAVRQVVALSSDRAVVEPFLFELNDLPTQLKVDTALAVVDSGNAVAMEILEENKSFIFDDFDGEIKSRDDIIRYGAKKEAQDASNASGVLKD